MGTRTTFEISKNYRGFVKGDIVEEVREALPRFTSTGEEVRVRHIVTQNDEYVPRHLLIRQCSPLSATSTALEATAANTLTCLHCFFKSDSEANLRAHMGSCILNPDRLRSSTTHMKCPNCSAVFYTTAGLEGHLKHFHDPLGSLTASSPSIHRPSDAQCPICQKMFTSEYSVMMHVESAHGEGSEEDGGIGGGGEGGGTVSHGGGHIGSGGSSTNDGSGGPPRVSQKEVVNGGQPSGSGRGSGNGSVPSRSPSSPSRPSKAPGPSSPVADLKAQLAHKDAQLLALIRGVNSLAAAVKCNFAIVTSDSSVIELAAAAEAIQEALTSALLAQNAPAPPTSVPELPAASVSYEHNQANSLGVGGGGDVYGGRLALDVAVKVVRLPPSSASSTDTAKDSFKSETAALCCLTHPNIVRLYGVVSESRLLVMEKMERSLSAEIEKNFKDNGGGLAPERLRSVSLDIARGMAHLHACGYVHRDLKPSNVLIDGSGRAKVSDFGLARVSQGEATLTAQQGTVSYMSPELLNEDPYGPPSDVYAFGMTLYHMLSGKVPWAGCK